MNSRIGIKRRQILFTCAAAAVAIVGSRAAPIFAADAKPQAARGADTEGWITLFDGKSLDGWHKNPQKIGHGTGGQWTIEEGGVLAGEQDPPGSGNGGIMLTDQKFGD